MSDPHSLLARSAGGDGWSRTEHLLAMVVDELRVANWQRSKKGKSKSAAPKPISPIAQRGRKVHVGKTDRSPAEVIAALRRWGPPPPPEPREEDTTDGQ